MAFIDYKTDLLCCGLHGLAAVLDTASAHDRTNIAHKLFNRKALLSSAHDISKSKTMEALVFEGI